MTLATVIIEIDDGNITIARQVKLPKKGFLLELQLDHQGIIMMTKDPYTCHKRGE